MRVAGLVLVLATAMCFPAAGKPVITGVATVIDGDTIDVSGTRIRLYGIDAPEGAQLCARADGAVWQCGDAASLALTRQLGRSQVRCEANGQDRYRRTIAVCFRAGVDINQWMVANGWAMAFRRYSMAYVSAEDRAQTARLGLWAGTFQMPWDWRRTKGH